MSSATAEKLTQMVRQCPVCMSNLEGHRFAQFATVICAKEDMSPLTAFFECVKKREWIGLRRFQGFKGDRDDVVAYVIACGPGGCIAVVKSVFDLYAPDELLLLESISQEDVGVIRTFLPAEDWEALST